MGAKGSWEGGRADGGGVGEGGVAALKTRRKQMFPTECCVIKLFELPYAEGWILVSFIHFTPVLINSVRLHCHIRVCVCF